MAGPGFEPGSRRYERRMGIHSTTPHGVLHQYALASTWKATFFAFCRSEVFSALIL